MENLERLITILDFMVKVDVIRSVCSLELDGGHAVLTRSCRHCGSFEEGIKKGCEKGKLGHLRPRKKLPKGWSIPG